MYLGDDWDEFLEYRIVEENKRLYPYRDVLEQDACLAA